MPNDDEARLAAFREAFAASEIEHDGPLSAAITELLAGRSATEAVLILRALGLEPHEGVPPGASGAYVVPGTDIDVNVRHLKKSWFQISLLTAALLFSLTTPAGLGIAAILALQGSLRKISDEELEVVAALGRLLREKGVRWVDRDELLRRLPDDKGADHNKRLLATVVDKGFIKDSAGQLALNG
jgi:hypothetical protein